MSIDTIERVEKFIQDDILTPDSYYGIFTSLNEDQRELGSGPYLEISVEAFTDKLLGTKPGTATQREEGVIVLGIFDVKASGKRTLFEIRDKIRAATIDPTLPSKLKKLYPAVGELGTIVFYEISQRPPVEVNRSNSGIGWRKLDVLISYIKDYNVS